jgi:hypothetical protein
VVTVAQPTAPKPGPTVGRIILRWSLVGVAACAALPVAVLVCILIRARGWRPTPLIITGAVALVVEVALLRQGLLAYHLTGWRTYLPAVIGGHHTLALAAANLWYTLPVGLPLGFMVGGAVMASAERGAAGAPWHPATRRRQERQDRRDDRRVAALLANPDGSGCTAPPLGVVRRGDLADWRQGDYAVVPAHLRGRAIAVAGSSGTGKTVLLRRLVATDGGLGRRSLFVDAKATEPGLADELAAAWAAGSGLVPRVRYWPAEAINGWTGDPRHLANRLLAGQQWSDVWYHRVASRTVRLACQAPQGPPADAEEFLERLSPDGLIECYADTPLASRVQRLTKERGFGGVELRYADYFDALDGGFDGAWSYDDADVAVLSLPVLAAREDAEAAFAFLLEDLGHYAVRLKARVGDDLTIYLDEFSALSDGAVHARDLAERLRDVGVGVVFVAQSFEGFGPPGQRERLLTSVTARVVHQMPNPEPLLAAAGNLWVPEQTWQLDHQGATGAASLRMEQRPVVDPDRVRRFDVGQVAIIQGGRYLEVDVLPADATPPASHESGPLRAADGWEVHRPTPEPGADLERLDDVDAAALPRVRLQLAAAVREGDRQRAAALAEQVGAVVLQRRRRRWRRQPAFLRWLRRLVHGGRR